MDEITYKTTTEFDKDLKKLVKKFRSLPEDLETVKVSVVELYHLQNIDNQSVFPIPHFCSEELLICKIKKFACKSLKGKGCHSGIRVVYSFDIESKEVEFIEIYYKGNKANEDKDRISAYLKK